MDKNDSKSAIFEWLSSRLNSPFIFSFITSFVIWNWKLVTAIFSDEDYRTTFWYVDHEFFWSFDTKIYVYAPPFIAACIYTFVWPDIDSRINEFTQWRRHESEIKRMGIDNKNNDAKLKISAQEPFPDSEREAFFAKWNAKVVRLEARLLELRAKLDQRNTAAEVERQAFLDSLQLIHFDRLHSLTGIDEQSFHNLAAYLSQSGFGFDSRLLKLPEWKDVVRVANDVIKMPQDVYGYVNLEPEFKNGGIIASKINANILFDMLVAIKVIGKPQNPDYEWAVTPGGLETLSLIAKMDISPALHITPPAALP